MVLRLRLIEGKYPPEIAIPGEHQLAKDFNASRVTIRRVLDHLEKENLIERRHGVGTFPMRGAARSSAAPTHLSYHDYIAASSHNYDDKLVEFLHLPTPRFLTDIDPGFAPVVLKIVRVAFIRKTAVHILRTFVPADIGQYVSPRALGNKTVLELLGKKKVVPEESELRIGAMAADTEESMLLTVSVGAPLVHATRISRLAGGRAIEYHQMTSVADKFGYRFLFDWQSGVARLPKINARG